MTLCMPLTCKRNRTATKDDGTEQEEEFAFTHFTYKAHWFVLSQTEGKEYQPPEIPEWNEQKALEALNIQRVEFEDLDGNTQGYAKRGGRIAVSPIAALAHKTLFHEFLTSMPLHEVCAACGREIGGSGFVILDYEELGVFCDQDCADKRFRLYLYETPE